MSKTTKYSAEIEFEEGKEDDFKELHDAIKEGKTGQNEFNNESDEESDKEVKDSAIDFQQNCEISQRQNSETSEEDETEPEEPGPRILWAAQHNNVDTIEEILAKNPELIKYSDEDGYTALHRAAYSGSKVFEN